MSAVQMLAWVRSKVRGAVVDGAASGERESRLEALLAHQLACNALQFLNHVDQFDSLLER